MTALLLLWLGGPVAEAVAIVGLVAAAVVAVLVIAGRGEPGDDGSLHEVLPPADQAPPVVEHTGADEEWSPTDSIVADPHPLDTGVPLLTGEPLVPAHFFDDLMARRPVVLDYPPISFTQEWALAGSRLAELGQTQPMPAVKVPA